MVKMDESRPVDPETPRNETDDNVQHTRQEARASQAPVKALLALMLLVNLAASLYQLPLNRVIERRLCREYYSQRNPALAAPDGRIDETLCKVDEVQQALGWIQGIMETAWIVGDFVMTIPLSFIAEVYGLRAIFLLNLLPRISMMAWVMIVGYFEHVLPTRAIIASPFLSVLGGDCVFNSLTYALAAGMADDHVTRATYFGYMSSVSYVVALLGPALASVTMTLLLWLPFWIGIALLLMAISTISRLSPDQQPPRRSTPHGEEQTEPLLSSPLPKADTSTPLFSSIGDRFRALQAVVTSHPQNFTLLLISFVLTSLASSDTKLLVQYISKRYTWTFASAGYLISAKAIVNFTLLAVVVPRILRSSRACHNSRVSSDRADVRYAKLCLIVSVLGALAIALSATIWLLFPSLLIYALGSALPVFTLSLLKSPAISLAKDETRGTDTQVFSIVMLVKTLGSLLGAPLIAALWVRGIALGGAALGMPYFVSAACYAAAIWVFSRIRVG